MDRASSKQGCPRARSRHQQNGLHAWRSSLSLWPGPIRSSQLFSICTCVHTCLSCGLGKNSHDKPILKNPRSTALFKILEIPRWRGISFSKLKKIAFRSFPIVGSWLPGHLHRRAVLNACFRVAVVADESESPPADSGDRPESHGPP